MNITYLFKSDVLYKRETYTFRYQGFESAKIDVLNFLNGQYAFEITILEESVPEEFQTITSGSDDLFKKAGIEKTKSLMSSEEECLNEAVRVAELLLKKYSYIPFIDTDSLI